MIDLIIRHRVRIITFTGGESEHAVTQALAKESCFISEDKHWVSQTTLTSIDLQVIF